MQVNAFSKTAERSSAMDISPPPFRLLDVFDDVGNIIEDPRKRRRVGLLCDGKTIYDDPSCLASQTEVSTLFAIKFPYFLFFVSCITQVIILIYLLYIYFCHQEAPAAPLLSITRCHIHPAPF
jgi:hypothetical protein